MQCPICKKDLEIKKKKVGENENGEAIYNEFAICRDCKKQWNLDKQREKKKKQAEEALAKKVSEAAKTQESEKPRKKRPAAENEGASSEQPSQPRKRKSRPVSAESSARSEHATSSDISEHPARPKKKRPRPAAEGERPARKPRPTVEQADEATQKTHAKKHSAETERPLLKYADNAEHTTEEVRPRPKKKHAEEDRPVRAIDNTRPRKKAEDTLSDEDIQIETPDLSGDEEENVQTYSNIPPKHVREKREKEMRENYQNMLDEEDDDDERHFPVVLVVILIFLIIAAAAFAGYWFLLK